MAQIFFDGQIALGNGSSSFSEVTSYIGYARQDIVFNPVANGQTSNKVSVSWTAPIVWQTITQLGIYDTSGYLILWWNIASLTLLQGQSLTYVPGSLQIYSADLASNPTIAFSYLAGATVGIIPGGTLVIAGSSIRMSGTQSPRVLINSISPSTDLSGLPTSDPGNGKQWLNGGILQVGPT